MTLPPRPPSPPSGPPNSTNFSRWNATQPAPPSPLFTKILHSSRNFMVSVFAFYSRHPKAWSWGPRVCLQQAWSRRPKLVDAKAKPWHDGVGEKTSSSCRQTQKNKKGNGTLAIPLCPSREWPRWELVPRRSHSVARLHRNEGAAVAGVLEADRAGRLGEQGVVLADADVGAGVELGAALANQDVAGEDFFRAELLDAEAPAGGIATVAG